MASYDYDLFVIGAGSGGVRASRMSASHGAKVAVAAKAVEVARNWRRPMVMAWGPCR